MMAYELMVMRHFINREPFIGSSMTRESGASYKRFFIGDIYDKKRTDETV
jgi:hypothetical protein